MAGGVLSALNTKLDVNTLASLLQELDPKTIFIDHQYVDLVLKSLDLFSVTKNKNKPPFIVIIQEADDQTLSSSIAPLPPGSLHYDQLLAFGKDDFEIILPKTECDSISVNFTSGSTGKPKGVVYSHRAAYLNSIAVIFRYGMTGMPVFLWTVDMFRCNGWCFAWAMAALGGTNICTRNVTTKLIFDSVCFQNVTHLFGAPTILTTIAEAPISHHRPLPHKVEIVVAGVLPPPQIMQKVEELGFSVSHAYGMTEALGPVTVISLGHKNDTSEHHEGIQNLMMEGIDVKDPKTMKSVPPDGKTIGEIMFKSSIMMTGYFRNSKATKEAFVQGWYRTGDIGIRQKNGYIELKDRRIDTIYNSKGENVSTIEVESVLASHPMIMAAAVVGRTDEISGETPCAFVRLKPGSSASEQEIIEFCGERLLEYMVPKWVVCGDLPLNSTGKVQKFVLRERAKSLGRVAHPNGH